MKTSRRRLFVGVLVVLFALHPVFAFHPKDYGHLGITSAALSGITHVVQGKTYRFSDKAVGQIVDANKDTDHLLLQKYSYLHFDSEDFLGSTESVVAKKDAIIQNLGGPSPDGEEARKLLGQALHTIQDYYAHSNWINLTTYPGTIDTRLGWLSWGKGNSGPPPTATIDIPTCETDNNNLEGTGFSWLTTGYFDEYNWCYAGPEGKGKCRHGDIDISELLPRCPDVGISKDRPGRPGYEVAHFLAIQASIDYVNQILNDERVATNPRAIRALMGVPSTLAVVVDDTGFMDPGLSYIKPEVTNVVNSLVASGDEPSQYILVRYSDAEAGSAFVTESASSFLSAVNALQPHGGVLCGGLSMTALTNALEASESDGLIFVFPSADGVLDGSQEAQVKDDAEDKHVKISTIQLSGDCTSEVDRTYGRIAAATGGHWVHDFFSNAGPVIQGLVLHHAASDLGNLFSETGTVNNDFVDHAIPLGTGLDTATFYVVFDRVDGFRGDTELIRPFGEVVQESDPDVTINSLGFGLAINVNSPQAGMWKLHQWGNGDYAVEAIAKTVGVNRVEFVTLTGRPGHEGLFPIQGQPVGPGPYTVLASVAAVQTPNFGLVNLQGITLQTLELAQGDPNAAADEFTGAIEQLPTQPFQVAARSTASGPWEYTFPQVFRMQSVEVTHSIDFDAVPAGATTSAMFTVRNAGASGQFSLGAVDTVGLVNTVTPSGVFLNSGQSVPVTVDLLVPLEAPLGAETVLALRATKTNDSTVTNTAIASLTVGNPIPAITAIDPTSAQAGHFGFILSVTGANFLPESVVRWNGADRVTTFVSPTELQAAIPETDIALSGTASVTVFNPEPAGGTSNAVSFPVNGVAPSLTSLSPSFASGPSDAPFTLTVNGQNFVASSVVRWNGSNRSTLFVNSTQLQASISPSDLDCSQCTKQVTVSTPNVGTSSALLFSIYRNPLPTTWNTSPPGVIAGSGSFTLTVNGSNFISGSVVRWNGADRTTTYIWPSQLQAAIPASDVAAVGTAQVAVFTPLPGGGTSNAVTFTINQAPNPVPQIGTISPTSVVRGTAGPSLTLTVNGSNFISSSVVRWNGSNRTTTFIGPTQLRATIPDTDTCCGAGTAQVTVFTPTPGGGTSNAATFTINNPVPVLSSMSPDSAMAGSAALTLVVQGSNFLPSSVVRWNGINRTTTYVGSNQIRATITMADLASEGTALVTVFTPGPGGGVSNALTFTILELPPQNQCEPGMICD